jgi:trehalose/maltose transport system substrate-binding protein
MKRPIAALTLVLAAAVALPGPAAAVTVTIACSSVGIELALCRSGAEAWAERSGHQVEVVSMPNSATERLTLYQQYLSTGVADIDVYQIDVIWPGILGRHFIDLSESIGEEAIGRHFPAIVANNTVDGELKAMPWFVDAGLLYYRSDLLEQYGLEVPQTWEDLAAAARTVQAGERAAGNDRFWGFVWQGRAYEGLTCNALEWIDSAGGGAIVAPDGAVTVNNPAAAAALDAAAGWVDTISPPGVLNYDEEAARGVFQAGDAAFMRNWPYAWALLQGEESPVAGRVGVAPLPRGPGPGGHHSAALGGQQLAVSAYSAHPQAAADLVAYLTGEAEQRRRAVVGAFNPTIPALYEDPEVLAANPFLADLYEAVAAAVPRPSSIAGPLYNELSTAAWTAVHRTLSGEAPATAALADLERELLRLSRGGRW